MTCGVTSQWSRSSCASASDSILTASTSALKITSGPQRCRTAASAAQLRDTLQYGPHQACLPVDAGLGEGRAQMRARGVERDPEVAGCFLQAATVRQAQRQLRLLVSELEELADRLDRRRRLRAFLDADEHGDRRTYRGFFGLDRAGRRTDHDAVVSGAGGAAGPQHFHDSGLGGAADCDGAADGIAQPLRVRRVRQYQRLVGERNAVLAVQ